VQVDRGAALPVPKQDGSSPHDSGGRWSNASQGNNSQEAAGEHDMRTSNSFVTLRGSLGARDSMPDITALLQARSADVLGNVQMGPLLGRGAYGRVYKGTYRLCGTYRPACGLPPPPGPALPPQPTSGDAGCGRGEGRGVGRGLGLGGVERGRRACASTRVLAMGMREGG
jgi:hypothetical protein